MAGSAIRRAVVSVATVSLVLLGGSAAAQSVYPPTPPPETELPTVSPTEVTPEPVDGSPTVSPTEVTREPVDGSPTVVESPTPAVAPGTEVLGRRLAATGTDIAVLAAVAGGLVAAGLVLLWSRRRRSSGDGTLRG